MIQPQSCLSLIGRIAAAHVGQATPRRKRRLSVAASITVLGALSLGIWALIIAAAWLGFFASGR